MRATRDYFGDSIVELAETNSRIAVFSCDLEVATRTVAFKKRFPARFVECGISEANAISMAAGMAQEGFRPFVCSFGHFLTGKFIEIFQSVGFNNADVVLVGTHAGLAIGKDGPTQMGLRDLGLMRLLQNIKILHPCDGRETRQAVKFASETTGPVYLRLCRQPGPELWPVSYDFRFGRVGELVRGDDILILSQGGTVEHSVDAATDLEYSVGVGSVSSLPIEESSLLKLVSRYNTILVVEDHFTKGGVADEVASILMRNGVSLPFHTISVHDYAQGGAHDDLYRHYHLDSLGIRSKCQQIQQTRK